METFVSCQLPSNWALWSISPPDLLSLSFSARRQRVTRMRIFQAGSQSQMLLTCFLCLPSSQHPHLYQAYFQLPNSSHEEFLTIFSYFLFFSHVDNSNQNCSHNFSTENPTDFFFPLESLDYFFSEWIVLCLKIILA